MYNFYNIYYLDVMLQELLLVHHSSNVLHNVRHYAFIEAVKDCQLVASRHHLDSPATRVLARNVSRDSHQNLVERGAKGDVIQCVEAEV